MPTEMELTLELNPTDQGVRYKVSTVMDPVTVNPHGFEGYSNQTWANDNAIFAPPALLLTVLCRLFKDGGGGLSRSNEVLKIKEIQESCNVKVLQVNKSRKGRMPTKIELTLEQSQQGVSNDVLVSIEGVEELKRNVWIKDDIMDPVMQCTTLPSLPILGVLSKKLSHCHGDTLTTIEFLTAELFLILKVQQAVDKSPTYYPLILNLPEITFRVILFSIHNDEWKSFQCHPSNSTAVDALVTRTASAAVKPCQGDSLNLPDHMIHKHGDGDALFQLNTDSLPHAHAQTTKTYYKHRDSRIMKAQELKTKTSAQTLIYKIFLQRYQVYQGILLESFQDDAKYDHVGQNTRSQGRKDDQDGRIKI
ncbi:hypothetical protein Tco_0747785 [Tanacetum coccineum]|uniref:Uncharacterized protein n=1 Tax=Tanacetum coccineum TaxID=301880 RepID=A0ABQ4YTQ1_9ASTR